MSFPTPSLPDLARAEGDNVDDLICWFLRFFEAKRVPWNYRRSALISKASYKGLHSLKHAFEWVFAGEKYD